MPENQNIEYKESWRDEYLKWICGFANAQGGIIFIGKNDKGKVVGLKDSKKLMTEIPNKIQATMGIVADVNLIEEKGLKYISIRVTPSSFPVSYHGEYHYRSGSTKQQLVGNALSQFIIEKTGVHWEDGIANNVSLDDLDHESISIFKKAVLRKGRMSEADLNVPDVELLDKLGLLENGRLKKSGALLFSKNPEKVQVGSFVKVGKFGEGPDLLYHDTIEGSLISIADKVIDLIFFKYLKAAISYEHDMRVEQYPFAREAVYNAIAHNCYMSGVPIQIRIDDNSMTISNTCVFPTGWTVETLFKPHKSIPYNPSIAKAFYLAGYIENWGRGIQKICDECKKINASLPEYEILGNDLTVRFKALEEARVTDEGQTSGQVGGQVSDHVSSHVSGHVSGHVGGHVSDQASGQVSGQVGGQVSGQVTEKTIGKVTLKALLDFCKTPKTRTEMQEYCGIKSRNYFANKCIKILLNNGMLKMTLPDKPNSANQKYFSL